MKLFLQNVSKIILLFSLLFSCSLLFAQENNTSLKEITGKVTHLNAALTDVNIINKSRNTGTKTNTAGNYSMHAKTGDVLQFSYVGFKTISITIEDVTSVLNIEMVIQVNELEEAVVTVKESERLEYERSTKGLKKFKTVGGVFHPNGPYAVGFLDGKDLHEYPFSLSEAINANVAGVELINEVLLIRKGHCPPLWDLDGLLYENEPPMNFKIIKDMYLVRSGQYVRNHYGRTECGVVIIRTIGGPYDDTKTQKEDIASQYTNKNYYNNDAITNYTNYSKQNNTIKEITGKVTHLNAALSDVNIINKSRNTGTKTNTAGNYSIHAKTSDKLQFSYVGMKTVSIVIEDVTSILNIEMITKINELQEAVVIADRKPGKELERALKAEEKFTTSVGVIDPKASGFSIGYVDGEDINMGYKSMKDALRGKLAGIEPILAYGIWDVDGQIFNEEPPIDPNNIKDVHVLKRIGSTVRYGTLGSGGVIVVRTKGGSYDDVEKKKDAASQYSNKNYYKGDAKTNYTNYSQQNKTLKEISGKVTHLNAALSDVNIINKNRNTGIKTNTAGNYSIHAKVGDKLQFSYVGLNTVTIIVEDITGVLNVKMITKINELKEAVVIADRKPGKELERALKAEKKFSTARGVIDPKTAGYAVAFVDGEDIEPIYPSIKEALRGKIAGYSINNLTGKAYLRDPLSSVLWEVDNLIYDSEPLDLDLANVKDIHILKSLAATNKYGRIGKGGVIVIRTKSGSYDNTTTQNKDISSQYTNKNYYKGDANTNYSNYSQENSAVLKEIIGKVTYLGSPLPDVNILNKNQSRGAKTNAQGNYTIQARTGDELQFSFVGFKTVTITVEDITSVLNIEMVVEITELEEAIVKTDTKGREYRRAKRAEKKFNSSMGTFDPKTAGYAVALIDGVEINIGNGTLTQALVGKLAGYYIDEGKPFLRAGNMSITQSYPAIWDIDGAVYTEEPPIDISMIKDIHVLKSLTAVNRYGNIANGGVIIVRTIKSSFDNNDKNKNNVSDQYTNQDYYNYDAIEINKESFITNEYTKVLTDLKIKQKAYTYYNDSLKTTIKDYNTHIGIAQDFNNYYKDRNLSSQILKDLALKHNKNPEILKAIAFQMQEYDLKKDVIEIYKSIFKLRPKYAQSYRDLANAYLEDNQFKKSWKLYMSYLLKGNDVSGEGIGQILYNEMEWLYFNRNDQSAINVQFVPKSENILDFRNDIRLVFEWNTSEAEFDLEFVNPKKQVYNFEHSLYKNQNLINDEKQKGYSSKEFIIDDVKQGQWLVNLTYQGNKKPEPTYLKVTTYYYWSKPNQHKKIAVYKLDKEHEKIQLYRLNKQSLMVVNK